MKPLWWFILTLFAQELTNAKEVNLKWKPVEDAVKYELEVSEDSNFSSTVISKTLSSTALKYELKAGVYYLRVRGIDQLNRPGNWNIPFKLVVTAPVKIEKKADAPEKEKITFAKREPKIETEWKTEDTATSYKVIVEKDGKEIETIETKDPKVHFNARNSGNYKIYVRSGMNGSYGPPVPIKEFSVEQKELEAAKWETQKTKWSVKKPVELEWAKVDGADNYVVKVYKIGEIQKGNDPQNNTDSHPPDLRKIASTQTPVIISDKLENSRFLIPSLPPGRYVANVESREGNLASSPSSFYEFDVKNLKPIEFEKLDLSARYSFMSADYSLFLNSGDSSTTRSNTKSIGGELGLEGNFWFPNSRFGLKAQGAWGGLLINNKNIIYNKLLLAANYRNKIARLDVRPYLGLKAWSVPIVVQEQSSVVVVTPTQAGPALGIDLTYPFSERWAGLFQYQGALPLFMSNVVIGQPMSLQQKLNQKVEVGVKHMLSSGTRLFAMAGFNQDEFSWKEENKSPSYARISSITGTVGVEASDDAGLFSSQEDLAKVRKDRFSDFTLSAYYRFLTTIYEAQLPDFNLNQYYSGGIAGSVALEGLGWLDAAKHGIRFVAGWGGFTVRDTTISNPEFYAQWAYRPWLMKDGRKFEIRNFLGLRLWSVSLLVPNDGPSTNTNELLSRAPQMTGPAETLEVIYHWNELWHTKVSAEASAPLLITNRDSGISSVDSNYMGAKYELTQTYLFSEDFTVGLVGGHHEDYLRYQSERFNEKSTVRISSDVIGALLRYNF